MSQVPPNLEECSPVRMIKVVIADDHPIVRRGVRQLLDAQPDCEVVAEAEDAAGAKRYLRGHHPDVLVIDLNMPGQPMLEALPEMRSEFPDTQIVVLTMQNEPVYARRALRSGVLGYVLKDATDTELVTAVRAAANGKSFLNPTLGARLAVEQPPERPGGLSDRELEVCKSLALGLSNAQVGAQLFISVRTVEAHRAHINDKLGVSDRQGIVQFALQHGLIAV